MHKKHTKTIFRNDDVSIDTDINRFMEFCFIFHQNGYKQLHGITLYGHLNCRYLSKSGIPLIYENEDDIATFSYEKMKQLSHGKFIGDNKELIDYLNSIPDDIALHGLYHSDYSKMTYDDQEIDISAGIKLLSELFPQKKISVFIAPFNRTNADTYKVCKKYNLKISALEGQHLEELIDKGHYGVKKGELYRYHHHRFYPESIFPYYKLDIKKLDAFLRFKKRKLPEIEGKDGIKNIVKKHHAQEWYIYAYGAFKERKHCYLAYEWIKKNISKNANIMESGCGIGGMLYFLYKNGYDKLSGYDIDEKVIAAAKDITYTICAPIDFMVADGLKPVLSIKINTKFNVIIGINWIYHVPGYSLEMFFEKHLQYLEKDGYMIFDMIDTSYNDVPNNQYCTQDWNKPETERRASEYLSRYSEQEVTAIAQNYGLRFIKKIDVDNHDIIVRKIYILQRASYRICLLCDRPNWAFDFSAREIARHLNNEFHIEIRYVIDSPILKNERIDLLHVFFWGETYHRKFNLPKEKIIKEISSHRWQDNPLYGPCTPQEMADKYLSDAKYLFCTSKRLFEIFNTFCENIFLTENGYSPLLFYYKKERIGYLSICWAGNIKDEVKGVNDILVPACGNEFKLNLASNLKHEVMAEFYNNNDIYVVCSRNEAEPLTLLEAMACGCFPVCCNVGIVSEIIKHKENGYIVNERTPDAFREAFIWCHDNLDFVREAGKQNAELMLQTKRWEIMAEGFRKMYRICLQKGEYK